MRVVILAGGHGTRMAIPGQNVPKPLVRIGNAPLVIHLMSSFAQQGFQDFVLALGFGARAIQKYFLQSADGSSPRENSPGLKLNYRNAIGSSWSVTLVDTGVQTMTGGRLKRLQELLPETFLLTYADGLSDVRIKDLVSAHRKSGAMVTLTAVQPISSYGQLEISAGDRVTCFREKAQAEQWINGGFMVVAPQVFDRLTGDQDVFERDTLPKIAEMGLLGAFKHPGFWCSVDTRKDKELLEEKIKSGTLPWLGEGGR